MPGKSELFLLPVDGLIWTFQEHSIDHTVAEIGTRKMSVVYARSSCDRVGETLSSCTLSETIFSGGKERLTILVNSDIISMNYRHHNI